MGGGRLRRTFPELVALEKAMVRRYDKDIPLFPLQRESELSIDNIDKVAEFLIFFLKKVVNTAFYDPEVQAFLDILPEKFGNPLPTQATASSSASSSFASFQAAATMKNPTASPCATASAPVPVLGAPASSRSPITVSSIPR